MSGKYSFSIKEDIAIVNAGGFLCLGCLTGKPTDELSLDTRYCTDCYSFLLEEAKTDTSRRSMSWKPVVTSQDSPQKRQEQGKEVAQAPTDVRLIKSTSNGEKARVDIIHPSVTKRGPRFINLPRNLIKGLSAQGMGSKAIATRLKTEGTKVSYKTI
jgi:hypothetical protein